MQNSHLNLDETNSVKASNTECQMFQKCDTVCVKYDCEQTQRISSSDFCQ